MDSHDIERYFQQHRRTLAVLLLIVAMTAVSGVFVGMRHTASQRPAGRPSESSHTNSVDSDSITPAPKYENIPVSEWLANDSWEYSLDQLPRTGDTRTQSTTLDTAELLNILEARSKNRAYDGAPPTIPHDIVSNSSKSCMACHSPDTNLLIGDKRPSAMSHAYYANCTQCHVPDDGLRQITDEQRLQASSIFSGIQTKGKGSRAYHGAPPTLPHPVFMRQNCMSCHGSSRPNAIRTSHPQRHNCLQCHAPDAELDNREQTMQKSATASP